MNAQVEDRHREAARTALNSATREQHGEWHPEVAAVAQLLADTEAAAREQGASVYSDSMDAERAGWVAGVAELERERDEAKRVALVADGALALSAVLAESIGPLIPKRDDVAGGTESRWAEVVKAINACGAYAAREQVDLAGLDSLAAAICDKSRLAAERDAIRSEVERLRAESAWVPCSERTPGPEGDYLCSFANGFGEEWVAAGYWRSPEWVGQRGGKVVAWRQLPAPYQEEAPDAAS